MLTDNVHTFMEWLTSGGNAAREFTFWAVVFAWLVGLFLIATMIRARPKRWLDRALLFREIAIVLILMRSSLVLQWNLPPQWWGGLLFMLLLFSKFSIVAALIREWGMTDEEVDKELTREADVRREKRHQKRNLLFRLRGRIGSNG